MTTTAPFHVIAICAGSGPVVIGSYRSARDQRRAYRDALATLRDGGYDRDVVRIELGSGEPGHVPPAPDQRFRQEAMNL